MNKIIGDIIRHMTPGRTYEKHYNNLNSVVKTIINNTNDFEALLSMVMVLLERLRKTVSWFDFRTTFYR